MRSVYSVTNKDAASLVGRSTHVICAMVALPAFLSQIDIDEILKNLLMEESYNFLRILPQGHDPGG